MEQKKSKKIEKWTRIKTREQMASLNPTTFDVKDDLKIHKQQEKYQALKWVGKSPLLFDHHLLKNKRPKPTTQNKALSLQELEKYAEIATEVRQALKIRALSLKHEEAE